MQLVLASLHEPPARAADYGVAPFEGRHVWHWRLRGLPSGSSCGLQQRHLALLHRGSSSRGLAVQGPRESSTLTTVSSWDSMGFTHPIYERPPEVTVAKAMFL